MATENTCSLFDELIALRDDPKAFEARCAELREKTFESMPNDIAQRMRGFQWRIDQQLAKCKDPVARFNRMVEIFWKGVGEFQKTLKGELPVNKSKAKVVELKRNETPNQ